MSRSAMASARCGCAIRTVAARPRLGWLAVVVTALWLLGPAMPAQAATGRHQRQKTTTHHSPRASAAASGRARAHPVTPARVAPVRKPALAPGAGLRSRNGSVSVRALQRALRADGYTPGPVDGRFGPLTESAVLAAQRAHGVPATGIVGPVTWAALHTGPGLAPGTGYGRPAGSPAVRRVQRLLQRSGIDPGAADGRYGPQTTTAVLRFQAVHRLPATGVTNARTIAALAVTAIRGREAERRGAPTATGHAGREVHARAGHPGRAVPPADRRTSVTTARSSVGQDPIAPSLPAGIVLAVLGALGLAAAVRSYRVTRVRLHHPPAGADGLASAAPEAIGRGSRLAGQAGSAS